MRTCVLKNNTQFIQMLMILTTWNSYIRREMQTNVMKEWLFFPHSLHGLQCTEPTEKSLFKLQLSKNSDSRRSLLLHF